MRTLRVMLRIALVTAAMISSLVLASCSREDPRLQSMINLEPNPPSRARIEELKALVSEYGETVAGMLDASFRQADTLRLLAQEYMREQLYGPALDALEEAIRIQPRNHILHYLTAVCAGYLGKSQSREELRMHYLSRAESAYRIALEIAPDHIDGRYGLAVLYVFELGRPLQAIGHLDRVLEQSRGHVPALFVLARAHVALGNIDAAVRAYDRIIALRIDDETRQRAERNRQLLLGGSM